MSSLSNITSIVKWRKISLAGHITCIAYITNAYKILARISRGKKTYAKMGGIILKLVLKKQCRNTWTSFFCLRIGLSGQLL
jgi:hypothetical protein